MGLNEVLVAIMIALFVVAPIFVAWLAWKYLHNKDRVNPDLCSVCGYDLCATPLRCPECGTVTPKGRGDKLKRLCEEWPSNPIEIRRPGIHEQPCIVFKSQDRFIADLLRQQLDLRGIQCELREPAKSMNPTFGDHQLKDCQVLVWSEDVNAAIQIVLRLIPQDEGFGNVVTSEPA